MKRAIVIMFLILSATIYAQTSVTSWTQEKEPASGPTSVTTIPPKTPDPLNDTQRLVLQNKVQAMEIAQLRFEAAKSDLLVFLKTLEREGFDIDIQTGRYVKKEIQKEKK